MARPHEPEDDPLFDYIERFPRADIGRVPAMPGPVFVALLVTDSGG